MLTSRSSLRKLSGMKPVLVIHAGAGNKRLPRKNLNKISLSINQILRCTFERLHAGASAIDAVTFAVSRLEDNPLFNAGFGSKLQRDGRARLSAAVMDGDARRFGGCLNVEGVRNPVMVARELLGETDRVLAGSGARRFARERGLLFRSAVTPERQREYLAQTEGQTGTVGAVALDSQGRLAAATSTGGRGFETANRVSDSATCAGTFANRDCAASATGVGEEIVEWALAASICLNRARNISLARIGMRHLEAAKTAGARFGFIALDRRGKILAGTTTKHLIWGAINRRGIL